MEDKPSSAGLYVHRVLMVIGSLLLGTVVIGAVMFGSNAAFDYATEQFSGSCFKYDSDAQLCVQRDSTAPTAPPQ